MVNCKKEQLHLDEDLFNNTGINITTHGRKHLGASVGSDEFRKDYISTKVQKWVEEIKILSKIAMIDPHSAYIAYTRCYKHKYNFIMRTIKDTKKFLQPLDEVLDSTFIPAILNGRIVSRILRNIIALPVNLGGLGIPIPTEMSSEQYCDSIEITSELTRHITEQKDNYNTNSDAQKLIMSNVKSRKNDRRKETLDNLLSEMSEKQVRILDCIREKGASNWITALPLKEKGFHLSKSDFWDAMCLRYNLEFKRAPANCGCGKSFSMDHALSCMKGGYISMRHDNVRDLTANLLKEVANDVRTEPRLIELTGEKFAHKTANTEDEARLDISARNFWSPGTKAFCDIRIFNPLAESYRKQNLSNAHSINEKAKKREYNKRVLEVEHGSFTPLVFSCYGGMAKESKCFYKQLACRLSEKRNEALGDVTSFIRTKLSFTLLKTAIICVRGYREKDGITEDESINETDIHLTVMEAKLK